MSRVAHLTSVHRATDTRIFAKECRTLADAGHEVTLVAPGPADGTRDGVRIAAVPGRRGRLKRMTATVHAVRRRALEADADIYHLHDPELLPLGIELRRRGREVIYDVHEDVPRTVISKDWLPTYARRPIARLVDFGEPGAARRLSAIVAATPTIAGRFEGLGRPVVTVNNYPILGDLSAAPAEAPEREHAVCYVGEIMHVRGPLEMIDAAGIAKVRLLLGGTFSERGLREEAVGRGGWSWVEELGQLAKPDVARVFARSRAGLVVLHPVPNYLASRPTKLFEYMSAGLPVIASDFPLLRPYVEEVGCGVCVDPLDPHAIAAAIHSVIDDPRAAEEMGARGRAAVEQRFNWEPEGKKLLELYAELA